MTSIGEGQRNSISACHHSYEATIPTLSFERFKWNNLKQVLIVKATQLE